MKYRNPVIPGFYPDPSICRVDEDFYLVNSSFEFYPGVPLHHSRDLVHWEQIGHVLDRPEQLPLSECGTSGGIFAPTIREHGGRLYMITTNIGGGKGRPMTNFLVHTDSLSNGWSDPVVIDHMGIDPSLFWDKDGKAYYTGTHFDEAGRSCIAQFMLDTETGEKLSDTKIIWYGSGGRCPEGPHMYYINGLYYLMIAEGGTEYGHMVTIARSDSVWGPFTPCPHNPILSHRDVVNGFGPDADGPGSFQAVGHGDLTCDGEGNWWMVFHAIRPTAGQLHHIGRETMLAPVAWDGDGWPVVNGGRPITAVMDAPGEGDFTGPDGLELKEDFTVQDKLSCRWTYLRDPDPESYRFESGLVSPLGSVPWTSLARRPL